MQKTEDEEITIITNRLKENGCTRNNPFKLIPNHRLYANVHIADMECCNIYIDATYVYIEDERVFIADCNYNEISVDNLQIRDLDYLVNALSFSEIGI